eukprot:6462492-Amphidinium_carterae.2
MSGKVLPNVHIEQCSVANGNSVSNQRQLITSLKGDTHSLLVREAFTTQERLVCFVSSIDSDPS